jgi:hypothetical protein
VVPTKAEGNGGRGAGRPIDSPTEMSCNAAAQIIADIRGREDHLAVKAALGCGDREECSVKNTVLFQVLDGA